MNVLVAIRSILQCMDTNPKKENSGHIQKILSKPSFINLKLFNG